MKTFKNNLRTMSVLAVFVFATLIVPVISVTAQTGQNLITSFNQGTRHPYTTLRTNGNNFEAIMYGGKAGGAVSNYFSLIVGKKYTLTYTFTKSLEADPNAVATPDIRLVSGIRGRDNYTSPQNSGLNIVAQIGTHSYEFIPTFSSGYLEISVKNDSVSYFSMTNIGLFLNPSSPDVTSHSTTFNLTVTEAPKSTPTNVVVSPGCDATVPYFDVSWDRIPGATGYKLYRTPSLAVDVNQPASGTIVTYRDSTVAAATLYGYEVTAIYGTGESERSNLVSNFTLPCFAPTLNASLTATPSYGPAPLFSTLAVPPVGGSATGDVTYQFKCTADDSWSSPQISTGLLKVTYLNTCRYTSAGIYTASAKITRQGITISPDLTATVTATSQTCVINSIIPNGADILISVTVSPRSTQTWTKITSDWGFDERERGDTNYTFTDSGAGAQPGDHLYNLNYGTCNAERSITIPRPSAASFNLSATPGTIKITSLGSAANKDLISTASTITIAPIGGFDSPVALSLVSVTKDGGGTVNDITKFVRVFSLDSVGSSNYLSGSKLTITSKKNAGATINRIPTGKYFLTIKGVSGTIENTVNIVLNVGIISFDYREY